MSFGFDTELNCKNCGSEYEFIEKKRPEEEADKEFCERCGMELMTWYGEHCCTMQLVGK